MSAPSKVTTVSILSLSMVTGVTTLITGIIPELRQTYPHVPTTWIEWLITSANLSALLTLMINPFLANRFGIRRVVITGLVLSAIAGVAPLWLVNFPTMFVSRLVLGLGVGLFSPHAIGLIAHGFDGELRARLLGYQTGMTALGNAALLALAGGLVLISWRHVFGLYLLLIIIAGLVWRFVPDVHTANASHDKRMKTTLPWSSRGLIALTFATYVIIWGVQLKLPSLFAARHFGNAGILNWTLAAMNVGGLVAGLTFGRLHRHLHQYTLTVGYAGAAMAVFLLVSINSAPVAIIAAIVFNFVYSYTGPYLVFTANTGLADTQINLMSSLLTIATIISAFFAPLVWNWAGHFGTGALTDNVLYWITASLSIIAVGSVTVFLGSNFINKQKRER